MFYHNRHKEKIVSIVHPAVSIVVKKSEAFLLILLILLILSKKRVYSYTNVAVAVALLSETRRTQ